MSEKISKVNGMTTEQISTIIEAFMTLSITMAIALGFAWQLTLVILALAPLQILGSVINVRIYKHG